MSWSSAAAKAVEPARLSWDPDKIPPFPAIALKALKLMAGTDTSLLDLCNLIRSDQAFSTAILRIANSPLVGFPKDVTSVLQASMLLGFGRLRSVAVTIGLRAYFTDRFTPIMKLCWRHSVACAIVAERGAKSSFVDNEFAYTAGILHDIGRVALATVMPAAYARVIDRGAEHPQDVLETEQELCGINHCEAGSSLVSAWSLPEAFIEFTGRHHDPPAGKRAAASLIPLSCALADSLGFGIINYTSPRNYSDILAEFPGRSAERFPPDPQEFAAAIAHEIKVLESV